MKVDQHTVPRMYLQGFSDQKGRLQAYDRLKQRPHPATLGDATVIKYMYTVPDEVVSATGVDPDVIENWLAEKEGAAAGQIKAIREGRSPVLPEHRSALAEFLAAQITRTSNEWQGHRELTDWYEKVWLENLSVNDVERKFREVGYDPSAQDVEDVMDVVRHPDNYEFEPHQGEFILRFMSSYALLLPYLSQGWNWVVVRSSRPFLTSDNPVVKVGDSEEGGLGIENASEIWLTVGRHHAIVLTRDFSRPSVILDLSEAHAKRVCQRIVLESRRWVYWHQKDNALNGLQHPVPGPSMLIRQIAWRRRPDGTVGELINFRPNRLTIPHECLLDGRYVRDRPLNLRPEWIPGKPPRTGSITGD